jgi:U3 small nucleolar RNA-associated protein 10
MILQSKLMHHLVSVFTFMGSLVLRHDDEYSLQIIAKVIDDVVPVIMKVSFPLLLFSVSH